MTRSKDDPAPRRWRVVLRTLHEWVVYFAWAGLAAGIPAAVMLGAAGLFRAGHGEIGLGVIALALLVVLAGWWGVFVRPPRRAMRALRPALRQNGFASIPKMELAGRVRSRFPGALPFGPGNTGADEVWIATREGFEVWFALSFRGFRPTIFATFHFPGRFRAPCSIILTESTGGPDRDGPGAPGHPMHRRLTLADPRQCPWGDGLPVRVQDAIARLREYVFEFADDKLLCNRTWRRPDRPEEEVRDLLALGEEIVRHSDVLLRRPPAEHDSRQSTLGLGRRPRMESGSLASGVLAGLVATLACGVLLGVWTAVTYVDIRVLSDLTTAFLVGTAVQTYGKRAGLRHGAVGALLSVAAGLLADAIGVWGALPKQIGRFPAASDGNVVALWEVFSRHLRWWDVPWYALLAAEGFYFAARRAEPRAHRANLPRHAVSVGGREPDRDDEHFEYIHDLLGRLSPTVVAFGNAAVCAVPLVGLALWWWSATRYGICSMAVDGEGRRIVSVARSPWITPRSELSVWSLAPPRLALRSTEGPVHQVALQSGGDLVAASARRSVLVWDLARRAPPRTIDAAADVVALSLSPGGRLLAIAVDVPIGRHRRRGKIQLWEAEGAHAAAVLERQSGPATALRFSPDGLWLLEGHASGDVAVYDVRRRQHEVTWAAHKRAVSAIAFSPRGDLLATAGSTDTTVRVWTWPARRLAAALTLSDVGWVADLAFPPDPELLAVACGSSRDPGEVRLFDVGRRRPRRTFIVSGSTASCVRFVDGGATIVVGSSLAISVWRGTRHASLERWDVATGRKLPPLP